MSEGTIKKTGMELEKLIRNIPDFPEKGIQFKDITTLLKSGRGFRDSIEWMVSLYEDKNIDKVIAVESRGFIFGAPVALRLGAGFVPVRKKNKLPADKYTVKYELEYGCDELQMHKDAVAQGEKVLIIDDLLATGGTTLAAIELLNKCEAEVESICFLIELLGLGGREKLKSHRVDSLIKIECKE